jgi:hypothetical protein
LVPASNPKSTTSFEKKDSGGEAIERLTFDEAAVQQDLECRAVEAGSERGSPSQSRRKMPLLGAIGIGKQQAATTLAKLKRAKAPIERAPAA